MILLLGGTSESRILAVALAEAGHTVLLTATTAGFAEAHLAHERIRLQIEDLSPERLYDLADEADVVVDATHPFATQISLSTIQVCQEVSCPYIRFERADTENDEWCKHVVSASNHFAAARTAIELTSASASSRLLLTIGSKNLTPYIEAARAAQCSIVARVLPTFESLEVAVEKGLLTQEIIAMQGPVSTDLELAFIKHYNIAVVVTKESGPRGGVPAKLEATRCAGIPLIVVQRPKVIYPEVCSTIDAVVAWVKRL